MSFKSYFIGDISNFSCDVVINSLGVKTTEYGGICKSIVKAAHSKELKEIIAHANDVYDVGEYFFTDGYDLPAKSICHLITPHHDADDKNLNVFVYSVRNVLNSCKGLEYKKIGIPLIGTGANKYDEKTIYDLLYKICESFCSYNTDIDITIVLAEKSIANENNDRLLRALESRGSDYHDSDTMQKFKKSTKYFINYYQYSDRVIKFDRNFFKENSTAFNSDIKMPFKGITKIPDYIYEYISAKFDADGYKKAMKNIKTYLGYGKNNPLDSGHNTFKGLGNIAEKRTMFKLCFASRMDLQDATNFLNFFGLTFSKSGINKEDDLVKILLARHTYGIVEINKEFEKEKILPLFK